MSRRSHHRARRRLARNQRIRQRRLRRRGPVEFVARLFDLPPALEATLRRAGSPYYRWSRASRDEIALQLHTYDRLSGLLFDVREEHDEATEQLQRLERVEVRVTGSTIAYAELDGIPICITEAGWCVRDFGHDGPHIYEETNHVRPRP